jgi:hypothetical protein
MDLVLANMQKDDFILGKRLTVKCTYDKPNGKWQQSLSDAIFLDSTDFFALFTAKLSDRVLEVLRRDNKTQGYEVACKKALAVLELLVLASKPKNHAMSANFKLRNSMQHFQQRADWGDVLAVRFYKNK